MFFTIKNVVEAEYFVSLNSRWSNLLSECKQFDTYEAASNVLLQLAVHANLAHPEDLVVTEVDPVVLIAEQFEATPKWWQNIL